MTNERELLEALRTRALDPARRTDTPIVDERPLPLPASPQSIAEAEQSFGFSFLALHRKLLLEIANGGFGPGYGLFGVKGGFVDDERRSLVELRRSLPSGSHTFFRGLPKGVLPLCEWGCAIWSCIDTRNPEGSVLTLDEKGLFDTRVTFAEWLDAWARGTKLWSTMFEFASVVVTNPFTRQQMTVKHAVSTRGIPYAPS